MMFSGVPTSWAMPGRKLSCHRQGLRPAQLLLEIQSVFGLRHHGLPGLVETLRHAVESLGEVSKLVPTLHRQGRPPTAFTEGPDRAGQIRHGTQDLTLQHDRDQQRQDDRQGPDSEQHVADGLARHRSGCSAR